jgi:hypothetical protein
MGRALRVGSVVGVIGVVGLGSCVYLMSRLTGGSRLAELLDYHPVALEIRARGPVYYTTGQGLSFGAEGTVDVRKTPVWTGPVDGTWVSPDSNHVVVLSGSVLYLLTARGEARATLKPAGRLFIDPIGAERPFWNASSVQWAADSRSFLILQYGGNAVGPVSLHRQRVDEKEPRKLLDISHPPRAYLSDDSLFVSPDGRFAYYTLAASSTDYAIYRYDAATGTESVLRDVAHGPETPEAHPVDGTAGFVSLPPSALADRDDQDVGWSWARSQDLTSQLVLARWLDGPYCSLFLHQRGELKLILRSRKGALPMSGSSTCGIQLDDSYYLPGNRYALVRVDTKQLRGVLVVDLQEGRYGPGPPGLDVFFPVNSANTAGVVLTYDGPRLELGLDRAALLPRLRAAANAP